ncbi:MAG TPA: rhodanese-like domain-containing protein [Phnomibacter sp.]|nr:rhodanese-like domain-containing protein [Phnomibacter sp.]
MKNIPPFRSLFVAILATVSFVYCSVAKVDGIGRLDNKKFEQLSHKDGYTILDVRTPEEYNGGHIAGAININVLEESNFIKALEPMDKDKKYLVYCRSGKRSMTAARLMKANGFLHLYDLEKGITGWTGPVTKPDDQK